MIWINESHFGNYEYDVITTIQNKVKYIHVHVFGMLSLCGHWPTSYSQFASIEFRHTLRQRILISQIQYVTIRLIDDTIFRPHAVYSGLNPHKIVICRVVQRCSEPGPITGPRQLSTKTSSGTVVGNEWFIKDLLKGGNTKPLVAKWPCCFEDIFIYTSIYTYIWMVWGIKFRYRLCGMKSSSEHIVSQTTNIRVLSS